MREPIPDEVSFPRGLIHFRAADSGDVPALLATVARVFTQWPPFPILATPEQHLLWYLDSWRSGHSLTWIAEEGGGIAAFSLGYERPTWVQGRLLSGGIGAYEGVDPEYRSMYLYQLLSARRREHDGRDVALSFSQVEALKRTEARQGGYQAVANPLSVVARILRPLHATEGDGGRALKRAPGYVALGAAGLLRRRRTLRGAWTIREIDRFDARVDALDAACATEFDFVSWRGHEFLNWRYFDRRTGPSVGLVAEREDDLLGYVVLRTIRSRTHIADVLVAPGRVDVARSLIDGGAVCRCERRSGHRMHPAAASPVPLRVPRCGLRATRCALETDGGDARPRQLAAAGRSARLSQ